MKTVVTGGAGFIGSHLVKRLLDEGRDVAVADDFSRGGMLNLRDLGVQLEPQRVDLRDYSQALGIVKHAETIFHLAARVGSVEYLHSSDAAEVRALQDNLTIDANIFRACSEAGVSRIVYASSVSVYPIDLQRKPNVVLSEEDLRYFNPEGGYGWAKVLGEIQLQWMKNVDGGIARIFNVYGEGEPLDGTAHVIPALIRKAIAYPKEDFIVWGDGNQSRCLIYVSDCVEALMRLEDKACNPPVILNLGSDAPIPVSVIAQKVVAISGKHIEIKYDPSRPVGPISRTADIGKARALLGWQPETTLDDGLRRTYAWGERRLRAWCLAGASE